MLSMEYDAALAGELGRSVEEVRLLRVSTYVKIREQMRIRGMKDIPETDEGMFLLLQRLGERLKAK